MTSFQPRRLRNLISLRDKPHVKKTHRRIKKKNSGRRWLYPLSSTSSLYRQVHEMQVTLYGHRWAWTHQENWSCQKETSTGWCRQLPASPWPHTPLSDSQWMSELLPEASVFLCAHNPTLSLLPDYRSLALSPVSFLSVHMLSLTPCKHFPGFQLWCDFFVQADFVILHFTLLCSTDVAFFTNWR